jgi:hypothetical protein
MMTIFATYNQFRSNSFANWARNAVVELQKCKTFVGEDPPDLPFLMTFRAKALCREVSELVRGALAATTSTRFDRVRGNHRSRSRFRSNVAFIVVNK